MSTTVVVTGAGRGIGRALALRYAADGARVVVNDLDGDAAAEVADETGGVSIPGDAASEDGASRLFDAAHAAVGDIDVWCANAGVERGHSLAASEEDWALSLQVNVMAHVRAARLLVPAWVERGEGRFVVTASAAGLLTMLGSPAYSVSKHGAVAFAEWLSATYRHRGIHVHAICPQAVRTRMLAGIGNFEGTVGHDGAIEPEVVAEALMDAIDADRFLVLPHPEVAGYYERRTTDTDRWLAGMNRIQQQAEEAR